jgi:hypothetical protein
VVLVQLAIKEVLRVVEQEQIPLDIKAALVVQLALFHSVVVVVGVVRHQWYY